VVGLSNKVTNKFTYLLGFDSFYLNSLVTSSFLCYQGHHGDQGAFVADLLLPSFW
jgi:NADH dehydrogenase (ubiquinone) Fe-S protein 1